MTLGDLGQLLSLSHLDLPHRTEGRQKGEKQTSCVDHLEFTEDQCNSLIF